MDHVLREASARRRNREQRHALPSWIRSVLRRDLYDVPHGFREGPVVELHLTFGELSLR